MSRSFQDALLELPQELDTEYRCIIHPPPPQFTLTSENYTMRFLRYADGTIEILSFDNMDEPAVETVEHFL